MLRNLLVALSLENRSFAKMSLGSSEGGQSLYALEDMLLEINIKQQMLSLKDLKNKVFVPEGKNEKTELEIHNFTGAGGVALSMYNTGEVQGQDVYEFNWKSKYEAKGIWSFLCGGSTGLFIYVYCLYYYHARSDMSGFMQTSFFFGYMACLCYGFFLMLGTVGFTDLSSLFVIYTVQSCASNVFKCFFYAQTAKNKHVELGSFDR